MNYRLDQFEYILEIIILNETLKLLTNPLSSSNSSILFSACGFQIKISVPYSTSYVDFDFQTNLKIHY
jgi:hypothetical protein